MRIILLDTDKLLVEQLQERSRKCGVSLDVFSDADLAFNAVQSDPDSVDVVIVSRELPKDESGGFVLTKKLRGAPKTVEVPFIVLSTIFKNTDFAKHQKGEDGANAYLTKPVTLAQVVSTIEAVTGLKFPSEKKTIVKKIPPKAPVSGLNVILLEASKVLRLQERLSGSAAELQLVFFAEEPFLYPPESEDEAAATEEVGEVIALPSAEPVQTAILAPTEIKASVDVVVEPVQVQQDPIQAIADAPPADVVVPDVAIVQPEPFTAQQGGGLEIDLSSDSSVGLELQSSSGGELKADAPALVAEVLEVVPVASPEPAAPLEISLVTTATAQAEVPAAAVEELDLSAPASFDAHAALAPAAPPEPVVAVSEQQSEQQLADDLPYLFGSGGTAALASTKIERSVIFPTATLSTVTSTDGSQITAATGDVETLKKYLMMREQDIAILSAQLGYAKEELGKADQSIKSLNMQVEDMVHQMDDRNQRIETLEKELMHAGKSQETELEQLRFELKSKIDRIKFIEDQLSTSAVQYEKLRERVRQDIRKIRVREKELENKLEILKKDSETLIAGREGKILELKRKIDLLEFNYDTLQGQNESEKANVAEAHEKIAKVVKVLKLAMGIIEGETTSAGKSLDENDLKVA